MPTLAQVIAHLKDIAANNSSGGGASSDAVLPAGPDGWTLVTDALDYEVGDDETTARLIEIPLALSGGFRTLLQCRFEGDDFPRLILVSDGSYYVGDGTFNPLQHDGGASGLIPISSGKGLSLRSTTVEGDSEVKVDGPFARVNAQSFYVAAETTQAVGDQTFTGGGGPVILDAADDLLYRIVLNGGVLSVEPVA